MKKYIITLSTLLCAGALHSAASQQNGTSGTGLLSFAKKKIFEPSNGDQACLAIKELWKKMKKTEAEAGSFFMHQALLKDLSDGHTTCSTRKKYLTTHQDIRHRSMDPADDMLTESSKETMRNFRLLQVMRMASEVCHEADIIMEKTKADVQTYSAMLQACDTAKELCATIEERTQNGYTIDPETRRYFMSNINSLYQHYQKFKKVAQSTQCVPQELR